MATTRRQRILEDIRTTLQTITLVNGYSQDVGTVEIGKLNPLNFQVFPVILIIPTTDRPERGATSVSRRELILTLRLWTKTHTALFESVEAFLQDVQTVMMIDPRRSLLAEDTREGELQWLYLPAESEEIEAGVDVEYTVLYRTAIGDPTAPPD